MPSYFDYISTTLSEINYGLSIKPDQSLNSNSSNSAAPGEISLFGYEISVEEDPLNSQNMETKLE